MEDDLQDNIRDNAKEPARALNDSGSMEQHDLKDEIEIDKYSASSSVDKNSQNFSHCSASLPSRRVVQEVERYDFLQTCVEQAWQTI